MQCFSSKSSLPRSLQVVATGGVYKGQGLDQRELVTRAYWEFLVHGQNYKARSLARRRFSGFPNPLGRGANTRCSLHCSAPAAPDI